MPFVIRNDNYFPIVIPDATEETDGLMSAADKTKLDGLSPGGGSAPPVNAIQTSDGTGGFLGSANFTYINGTGVILVGDGTAAYAFSDGTKFISNGVGDATLFCASSLSISNGLGEINLDNDGTLDFRAIGLGALFRSSITIDTGQPLQWQDGFNMESSGSGGGTIAAAGGDVLVTAPIGGVTLSANDLFFNGFTNDTVDFEGWSVVNFGLDGNLNVFRVGTADSTTNVNLASTQVNGDFRVVIGPGSNTIDMFSDQTTTIDGSSGLILTSTNGGASLNSDVGTVSVTAPNGGVDLSGNGETLQLDGGGDPGFILNTGNGQQFRVNSTAWLFVDPNGTGEVTMSSSGIGGTTANVKAATNLNLYGNIANAGSGTDVVIQNFGVTTGKIILQSNEAISYIAPLFNCSAVTKFDWSPSSATFKTSTGDTTINGGKFALYAGTPHSQAAAITAPTGGATIDTQARTAINAILSAIGKTNGIGVTAN